MPSCFTVPTVSVQKHGRSASSPRPSGPSALRVLSPLCHCSTCRVLGAKCHIYTSCGRGSVSDDLHTSELCRNRWIKHFNLIRPPFTPWPLWDGSWIARGRHYVMLIRLSNSFLKWQRLLIKRNNSQNGPCSDNIILVDAMPFFFFIVLTLSTCPPFAPWIHSGVLDSYYPIII